MNISNVSCRVGLGKTFVTDLDGVLLNTAKGFSKKWTALLGKPVSESAFIHWGHDLSLGVPATLKNQFWDEFWRDVELEPYPGAGVFIDRLKYLGFKVIILTSRSFPAAEEAMWRDIVKIRCNNKFQIDDIVVCDHRNENKSSYINKIQETEYFLDDHVKNTADVQLRCPRLKEVFLFDQPWNTSLDLGGYTRVYSYGDVLAHVSKHI